MTWICTERTARQWTAVIILILFSWVLFLFCFFCYHILWWNKAVYRHRLLEMRMGGAISLLSALSFPLSHPCLLSSSLSFYSRSPFTFHPSLTLPLFFLPFPYPSFSPPHSLPTHLACGPRERCKLLPVGLASPAAKRFWCILALKLSSFSLA